MFAILRITILMISVFQLSNAHAYKLIPFSNGEQGMKAKIKSIKQISPFLNATSARILEHYSDPVHEGLTAKIYGCEKDLATCGNASNINIIPSSVLAGVRWNDNPKFKHGSQSKLCRNAATYIDLSTDVGCWLTLFYDADIKTHFYHGKNDVHYSGQPSGTQTLPALIYRVHFGDLQFLHAMGSWDGEPGGVTQANILMWAEFTYKTAVNEPGFATLDTPIHQALPGLAPVFEKNGFSARSLFSPAAPKKMDDEIRGMAFGSLLHMMEDSFSKAHVNRGNASADGVCKTLAAPGKIMAFYAYNHQSGALHGEQDAVGQASEQMSDNVTAVSVGQRLLAFSKSNAKWEEVKPYMACIFDVLNTATVAGPGAFEATFD